MNFNLFAICAIVAAAQALFFVVILFSKEENRLANRILGAMLVLLAYTLVEWALWWTGDIEKVPGLKAVSFGFPLLFGPLMFLFYQSTFERKQLAVKTLWHFLSFVVALILMLPFYLRDFETLSVWLVWIPPLTRQPWFPFAIFAQMIGYGIWVGLRFKKYFLENGELQRWHRWLLVAYWGIVSAYVLYRFLPWLGLKASEWQYLIAFSLTVFIYLIAWLGYIEPRVFAGMSFRAAVASIKYHKSSLTAENSAAIFQQLIDLMDKENLYRESQITLDGLGRKIGAARHHLSQAINEQSGKRFTEWVNDYRIKEALLLLESTTKQELNVIEVAYAVGFNSKNAFNLVFKRYTGLTPTEYRQTQKKKVQSRRAASIPDEFSP
ncbi:MAG: helix-turn-helix domain-containing protein [Saprospiraceae bacterium]